MYERCHFPRWAALAVILLSGGAAWGQEAPPTVIPPPALDAPSVPGGLEKAVLAGGCYWGTQGIFEHVKGIRRVVAGFSGGYSDSDGAAEAVMITFDPRAISYAKLLQIFFSVVHDPTELDRQGPDVGISYRSDIFYLSPVQQRVAAAYIAQLDRAAVFPAKLVTRVDPLQMFHPADFSQQNYMIKNPNLKYILVNDVPKLGSLKQFFPSYYQAYAIEYRPASSMLLSGE
ncbi:MAG: peptide-methionine (S)-S-oxide reductase MsrA [Steroidobacteraceae bacterium]